jgi:hypothetical protein
MSSRFKRQDATGVILENGAPDRKLYVAATTTPTNGVAGYEVGCVWVNTAGSASSIFYVNTGTRTSATWTNLA